MKNASPIIVIVTRKTRLAGLKARWATVGQAKFRLGAAHAQEDVLREHSDFEVQGHGRKDLLSEIDFVAYEKEDDIYERTLDKLQRDLNFGLPVRRLDRSFLPSFDFWNTVAVVVVGPDGLVANTAKYVGDKPVIGVNPDPRRIDGVLLPFDAAQARRAVGQVLENHHRCRPVTLAEAQVNDGQKMLAFNDLFVGSGSHVSARYTIEIAGRAEPQSSSGLLVSTGVGSTGWMSSVFNMTAGVAAMLGHPNDDRIRLDWEDRRLLWAVREPFLSKQSRADLVAGLLADGQEIIVESLMPSGGVIFSDGIEDDFLEFNSGTIARLKASAQHANLVVP